MEKNVAPWYVVEASMRRVTQENPPCKVCKVCKVCKELACKFQPQAKERLDVEGGGESETKL
jgi:hypothetical protein